MQRTSMILTASFGALASCGQPPPRPEGPAVATVAAAVPGGDTPAARIGNDVITLREVDKQILGQMRKLDFEHAKQIYETRKNSLDSIIADRVLSAVAKKRNQTVEQYVKAEVEKTVPEATEAEAKKFYDENTARMGGGSFEQMKGRITEYLTGSQRQAAATKLVDEARAAAGVQVLLEEPAQARVEVAAVGPSKGPANAPITLIEFSDFQ